MRNAIFERDIFVPAESGGQRLSIAVSTALQAGLLAAFLVLSLLGRQILPPPTTISVPWPLSSPPSQPTPSRPHSATSVITRAPRFVYPQRSAPHVAVANHAEEAPPPSLPFTAGCSQSCSAPFWPSVGHGSASDVRLAPTSRPVISHLEEGQIQNRVQPIYPQLAKVARVEGDVLLSAVIAANGEMQQLQVASGPALLQDAALKAVRQWRFRPYILNGKPIEIEARITIRFRLQ